MDEDNEVIGPAAKPPVQQDSADAPHDVVVVRALLIRVLTLYAQIWPRALAESKIDVIKLTGAAEGASVNGASKGGSGGESVQSTVAVARPASGLATAMAPALRAPVLILMQSAR